MSVLAFNASCMISLHNSQAGKLNEMIVNDTYKFIFLHIPKNAGTSIRTALSTLDGTKTKFVSQTTKHETFEEFLTNWPERSSRPLQDIDEFRVLAVIRNPWDRFLSLHRYLLEKHRETYPDVPTSVNDFSHQLVCRPDWIENIRSIKPQVRFLDGLRQEPVLCRFEYVQNDLSNALARLGAELPPLAHLNSSGSRSKNLKSLFRLRSPKLSYRQALSPQAAEIIAKTYSEDIKRFQFNF